MNTEISIDDKLFNDAEDFSKAVGLSRSKLYCIALSEYMQKHSSDTAKGDLKKHYSEHDSRIDDDLKAAADRLLPGKLGK
jgi:antitoxin component of RelBE/YafQ-DinJ toxin-antitoxin module